MRRLRSLAVLNVRDSYFLIYLRTQIITPYFFTEVIYYINIATNVFKCNSNCPKSSRIGELLRVKNILTYVPQTEKSRVKKKKSLREFTHILTEKSWSHLSPYAFPFLFLYLATMPWHTGRPTSQGWESPVPRVCECPRQGLGGARHTKHEVWVLSSAAMDGKPLQEHPLPPSFFICPFHATTLPENSSCPEEGEGAKKVFA